MMVRLSKFDINQFTVSNKLTTNKVNIDNSNANRQNFEGALSTGLRLKKVWLTSGYPDVRESHRYYEQLGPVPMDYEYAPGLKYPGDPNCKYPKETEGCRCDMYFEDAD